MDLGIAGRVALISGGSAGIGFAAGCELAREGVKVALVARNQARLDAACERLAAETGGTAFGFAADMTAAQGIGSAIAAVEARLGPIDIAVTNVEGHSVQGDDGPPPGFFSNVPPHEYAGEFRQLVLSALHLIRAVAPDMRERGYGRVVNIGSVVMRESLWDLPHILPNTARPSAWAVHRAYARAYAGTGVTFNALLTGSIATDRNIAYLTWLGEQRGLSLEEIQSGINATIPLGRSGRPDEMAAVIAFLCSGAAKDISGQGIQMGGGGWARHIF